MSDLTPLQLADQLASALQHTMEAHSHFPKTPSDAIRFADGRTPYAVHPIWCAMTLLSEPALPEDLRYYGYLALLWHDTLEDTLLPLPDDTHPTVRTLVEEMTFDSFADELNRLWERSDTTKLLKLYDKVSQFLDGTWMSDAKWNILVAHTRRLQEFVEANYGELNIIKIARVLCQPR